MYTEHFQLKTLPFENVPNPVFFFDKGEYHRVRERMTDSLTAGRGLLVIAGPIGSGKTTLCQKLKSELPATKKVIWLAEPPGSSADLFLFLSQELGLESPSTARAFIIRDIRDRLLKIQESGSLCLMIIDESHLMSDDELEGIRLLNNLEEDATKLIQIILLGQEELIKSINRPGLEPFRQRIAALEVIGSMEPEWVREYILHRIRVAGGKPGIFADAALEAVTLSSGGIPRVTNSLCDRALRICQEQGKTVVDVKDVHRAATDLGLGRKTFHTLLKHTGGGQAEIEESDGSKPAPEDGPGAPSPPVAGRPPGMRGPLLLLMASLAAFSASLWFYCGRAGGDGCLSALATGFF